MTPGQIQTLQTIYICIAAWVGLCVGSFLNVVVYRLPIMIRRRRQRSQALETGLPTPTMSPFNLSVPRSRCPICGHQISWFENIPVASYIALGGKCSSCKSHISKRYPIVEAMMGALFACCIWLLGVTPMGISACLAIAILLPITLIYLDGRAR